MQDLTFVTPTICKLMDVESPVGSNSDHIETLTDKARTDNIAKVDKCLIYAPDAVGMHLYEDHRLEFDKILDFAPLSVRLRSMIPPKTPVCFASMFTGLKPDSHGINIYSRPVLKCATLFDAMILAGKKVAIVAVKNSSIDLIFRERQMDYFSEDYDQQVTDRTIQLLEMDQHDVIVAYHQEYDDALHKTAPDSAPAIAAFENHINSFTKLAGVFNRSWSKYNRMLAFAPDHGAHFDSETQKGTHGLDISEDMEISHFYAINKQEQQ
ncbi:MAG: alkaline phosphatase family protein [Sedimentisphaerales bacterium]|nr:alkaline phosphatase family protein [Sedimentisphaerales bacterium]